MSLSSPVGCEGDADCGCGCSDRGWGGADVWAAAGTGEGSRSSGELSGRSADRGWDVDAWPAEGRPATGSFETKWPPGGGRPSTLAGWEDVWPATGVAASLSMTPHLLTPPEGWEDYSECEDELRGSEEECLVWVTPRTQGEFWDLRAGDTEDALQIIGATTEETGLLRKAWAVLVDSTDLVRWSACWYTGRSGAGDCMIRHIEGRSANRTVIEVVDGVYRDADGSELTGAMMSAEADWGVFDDMIANLLGLSGLFPSGRITVYRTNYDWARAVEVWSGAARADRYCVTVHIAAVLLHELTHVCMSGSDYPVEGCKESYLTQGVFLYALHHAWPGVVESRCCLEFWGDSGVGAAFFGNNEGQFPNLSSCPDFVDDADAEEGGGGGGLPQRGEDDQGPTDDKGLPERPEWRYP